MLRDPFARLKSEYKLLFIGGSSRRNTFKQKPDQKKTYIRNRFKPGRDKKIMVRDPFAMLESEYKLLFIGGSSRRNSFKQKPEPTTVILIEKIGSNLVATKKSWFATRVGGGWPRWLTDGSKS